jgi:hypothetical protein
MDATPRPLPTPRSVPLPGGRTGSFYTREQVTALYGCSHAELGRLLRDKIAPMPIRVDNTTLWYQDEVSASAEKVKHVLERRRK